jgi:hypothetical protein
MTQTLHEHMNKIKIKKKRKRELKHQPFEEQHRPSVLQEACAYPRKPLPPQQDRERGNFEKRLSTYKQLVSI